MAESRDTASPGQSSLSTASDTMFLLELVTAAKDAIVRTRQGLPYRHRRDEIYFKLLNRAAQTHIALETGA